MQETAVGSNELEQLQRRFEEYRNLRPSRGRLPAGLWKEAAEAARRYGLNPTAQAWRLDYNRLKKRMAAAPDPIKQRKQVHVAPPAGDEYAPNPSVVPPQGERQRTYFLKDAQGHPWPNAPVIVRERFSNKVGPGPLPAANGNWYYGVPSPGPSAVALDHSRMTDHYGLSGLPPLEVGYVQYYYASDFTAPSWLQLPSGFSLPGVTVAGPVVPLWIKDRYNSCEASLGGYYTMLAGQPVRLNPNYTGVDGDNGPPPAQGCAPPF